MAKHIIYQILPRLWGANNANPKKRGSLEENGCGKFKDIDDASLEYFKWLGCTHIWYTGVIRHATKSCGEGCEPSHPQIVKGEAGSPYAIRDYYDVNPYLAVNPDERLSEFRSLVDRTHRAGLKVIIDFVPNHVSRDYGAGIRSEGRPVLGAEDNKTVNWAPENDFLYYPGTSLKLPNDAEYKNETEDFINGRKREYRIMPAWTGGMSTDEMTPAQKSMLAPYSESPAMATGNNCFTPEPGENDWYETVKINYCDTHSGTWDKMRDIIEFWISLGVDGFRCDMVELVPSDFFKWLISDIKSKNPDVVFIAEVYRKELYKKYIREVGFDILYDKSGMYDILRAVVEKNVNDNGIPVELWQSATGITRNWQYLGDLQPYMLNFLENHDEQRFASDFFGRDASNQFAPLYASLFFNVAPFMIYFGQEVGERGMDEEGFSGRDGRTSIFDWWSIASIIRLRKVIAAGAYKSLDPAVLEKSGMTGKEAEFFCRFASMIRTAADNPAVSGGTVYDLCYCNYDSEGFDKDRHFVFLRDYEERTVLVACNFSLKTAALKIRIPAHAFDWMQIPVSDNLNTSTVIEITVPPMDGIMKELEF